MKTKLIIFTIFLLMLSSVHALEYSVTVNSPSSVNAYEGDKIANKFSATITNNAGVCDITCGWATTAGQDSGIKVAKDGGKNTFNFDVNSVGSGGTASYSLVITCDRISAWNCWSDSDQRTIGPYQFSYLWNGDGICTTEREKCANYNQFLKDTACSCQSDKECKPNSNRGADDKGCATFCGNNKVEKQFETCSSCPDDVGKCDGLSCISASECEGNYCVHNTCSHLSYIKGDTYCDSNEGENCKNSVSDCVCGPNKRCSSAGICETYCGNGVCEASEQGICKADCDWCGDGTCQSSESCSSCSVDCGECKKSTKQEELQRNTQLANVPQTKNDASSAKTISPNEKISELFNENKKTVIITGVLLVIVIIAWSYYFWKRKKETTTKDKEYGVKCAKCHKIIKDKSQKFCHSCGHKIEHETHKESDDKKYKKEES